jgi:hypothetical protein
MQEYSNARLVGKILFYAVSRRRTSSMQLVSNQNWFISFTGIKKSTTLPDISEGNEIYEMPL